MDYLLEVERNPDLQQAVTITAQAQTSLTPDARASLLELERMSFLATQHPNAWVGDDSTTMQVACATAGNGRITQPAEGGIALASVAQ